MVDYCNQSCWDYALDDTPVDVQEILVGAARLYMQPYASDSTSMAEVGIWTPEMGATLTPEIEGVTIYADQYRVPLRHINHTVGARLKIQLLRNTMDTQLHAWISNAYAVDASGNITTICMTGSHYEAYWRAQLVCPYRTSAGIARVREIIFPKLAVANLGDMVFKSREAQLIDLEFLCIGDWDISGHSQSGLLFALRDRLQQAL